MRKRPRRLGPTGRTAVLCALGLAAGMLLVATVVVSVRGADSLCRVSSPEECPATMNGQTQRFENSSNLDTRPYLRGRTEEVWALCVPISIAGRSTGVLHVQRPVESPSTDNDRGWELVARKTGDRLGMLRAFARSETQAQTDPLTGLLNRRASKRARVI